MPVVSTAVVNPAPLGSAPVPLQPPPTLPPPPPWAPSWGRMGGQGLLRRLLGLPLGGRASKRGDGALPCHCPMVVSAAVTRVGGRGRGIISAARGASSVHILPLVRGEEALGTLLPTALGARRSAVTGPMAEVPAAETGPKGPYLLVVVQGLWIRGLDLRLREPLW